VLARDRLQLALQLADGASLLAVIVGVLEDLPAEEQPVTDL
jgi:hypothetical protein